MADRQPWTRALSAALLWTCTSCSEPHPGTSDSPEGASSGALPSLLVFSKTEQYRHAVIGAGIEALRQLALDRGWAFAATENSDVFTDAELRTINVVVFLNTTGDILNSEQQSAMERFIQAGHGFVGVHSATDTEYDWPWYGELVGARFKVHPAVQLATVHVEDAAQLATQHLPAAWTRTDEWYGFAQNPRPRVHVLLTLDESSYQPESSAMGDHPVAWDHLFDGGRAFYTALGHTVESYQDADFMQHLAGGILWASSR